MEKIRQDRYQLSQEELKPYFQLDNMINGMFHMAGQLYGLQFTENTGEVPVFHPDVEVFEVTNKADGSHVGLFYSDDFARAGKRSGAWMTTYRSYSTYDGVKNVLASNNNNFIKAEGDEPILISLDDAETLFHEFGHALHYLSYRITYPALGVTPRDYVGAVIGNLNSRRGRIMSQEIRGTSEVVRAHVPLGQMFGYATDLRSMTQGRATYTMQFARYEEVPPAIAEEITAKAAGKPTKRDSTR
jgi:hypothetical protein